MKNYRLTEPFLRRVSAQLAVAIIAASSAWAQSAGTPGVTTPKNESKKVGSAENVPGDEIIELSPFQVEAASRGYEASNTMSGTRINSKIEDIAASISVITKAQLDDTASLDINDVFRHEVSTEGMAQFTQFTIDRNFYVENTTQNPQSANRIRGLNTANVSINNFPTSGIVPIDTYNIENVEISRGPNSNIFGLGNAAGTVNTNLADANTSKDITRIVARADSYGGWRSNVDFNRVLKKDRLAIRVSALRDEKGFVRKPSYENINRLFTSLVVKPTKNTTFTAAYESYNNHFSRANTTLPRDSITEWLNSDRPVWNATIVNPSIAGNPVTGGYRYLKTGGGYIPVAVGNESLAVVSGPNATNPATMGLGGLPSQLLQGALNTGIWTTPGLVILPDGRVQSLMFGAVANVATNPAPSGSPVTRLVEIGSYYRRGTNAAGIPTPLYQAPSITDKSIYDWTELNILAANYGRDRADTYRAQLNHTFLNTSRHLLAAEVGHYREVIDRRDHSVFGRSDSAVPFLEIDINETLIDGSPNPNFLRPYMGGSQPTTKDEDRRHNTTRGALAYRLDFSHENGWARWLGTHTFNLYGERKDDYVGSTSLRYLNLNDYSWSSANELGSYPVRGNSYRIYPRYYLGDTATTGGRIVDNAPSRNFDLSNVPLTWYTPTRTARTEAANIQEVIASGSASETVLRSKGVIWQGSLWEDRIVPTIGWREDRKSTKSRNLNGNPPGPTQLTSTINPATRLNNLDYLHNFTAASVDAAGQSRQQGIVFKATKWLNLNYNQSDGFKPENIAYDINTRLLLNPTGDTKDYGITLKLFDNKLTARITRYKTVEKNSRNGAITSAAVTRTLRLFFDPRSTNRITGPRPIANNVLDSNGQDALDLDQAATQWILQQNPTFDLDQAHALAVKTYLEPIGITQEFIERVYQVGDSGFTDVNTVTSTGTELELNFNPTRYWTLKVTGSQQKAVDTELGNAVQDFIKKRIDAIQNIVVPDTSVTNAITGNKTAGLKWWEVAPTGPAFAGSPQAFYIQNVYSVVGLATANAGKPRAQTREYQANLTTSYKLDGISDSVWTKNTFIGGAAHWASKAAQGYYSKGPNAAIRNIETDYDPNRPIYDKPRTTIDLNIGRTFKLKGDAIRCKVQLNVNNVFESGRLQAIAYNPDGQAWNYRIIDPRQFILTTTFDF